MAPSKIGLSKSPHLSPVGSLTNLLTDLSSTGFRKQSQLVPAMPQRDYQTIKTLKVPPGRNANGLHLYSQRVEKTINKYFAIKDREESKVPLESFHQQELSKAL